jgi:hypothetical protein
LEGDMWPGWFVVFVVVMLLGILLIVNGNLNL